MPDRLASCGVPNNGGPVVSVEVFDGYIPLMYTFLMDTAKIFQNGRSQAVRLPKEFRFESDEVYVTRLGSAVVLLPKKGSWDVLFDALDGFTEDFMEERGQPREQQERDLDL